MVPNPKSRSRKGRGIQRQLVLSLLFVFIPALLIETYIHYDRLRSQRAHELQLNLEIARAVSRTFEAFVQDVLHQELAIGLAITSSQSMAPEDITRLLGTCTDYAAIRDFSWVSPQGVFIYSSNSAMVGADNRDRAYFRDIENGREWTVGELVLARTTGVPVFGISRGIRDERGALLGVVVATVIPEKLGSVLAIERGKGGGLALVDNKGMLVYRHPAIDMAWEKRDWLNDYPEFGEALKGKETAKSVYAPFEGKRRLVGFVPVPSVGWAASAGSTEEIAMEAATATMRSHAALFLGVMVTALGAALLLSRTVSVSIKRMRDHALALGRGETEGPTMVFGTAELVDLADAFNAMAEKVRLRELELREREEWLRVTLSSIGDSVIATDITARVTFINPVASELTGWGIEEALGQPVDTVFRIVDEKTGEPAEDLVQRVLREARPVAMLNGTALVTRDGHTVPIEDSAAPIKDNAGRVMGVVIVFHDVSEKRRALESVARLNQDLERRLAEMQAIFDIVPVGLSMADDPEGLQIRGNRTNEQMLGVARRGELSKRAPQAASFRVLQDGRELAVEELPMQRAIRGEVVTGQIIDVMREDGQLVALYCNATPLFDEEGRPRGAVGAFLDFTEIKRAQEALHQALGEAEEGKRTLEALMEYVPEGITIVEAADLKIRMVSRYGQDILGGAHDGLTAKEVAGLWKVYHEDGKTPMEPEDLPLSRAVRAGEVVKNVELIQVNSKGERLSLLCNAAPIRDHSGDILGGIVAWRDITEIRSVQDALRDSQERYRNLFLAMSEGFALHEIICDAEGLPCDYRFLEVNPAFERQTGLKAGDLIGRTLRQVLLEPESYWIERYGRVALTGEPDHFEQWAESLGRHYEVSAFQTGPGRFATLFLDITERKRIEQALRESHEDLNRAQAVAQAGSWRLDVWRNELLWSDENHRIFGISRGTPLTYETFLGTVHPDDREYVHEKWTAALRGEPYDIEHRIVLGDTVKWVRERAELEFDEQGGLLGGFGTTQDVTERKRAEQAVLESEARFRLLSETAGGLLALADPQGLVNDACRRVMEHLDCQVFFNFLADEQAGRLHLNACAGIPDEEVRKIEWLDYGVAVCGCVAREGCRIVAEDIFHVPDVRTELVKAYGIQAYACHPLKAGGRVIGTLSFGTKTRSRFSPRDLELMKTVADQVAVAMERMRLIGELRTARDGLEARVRDRTAQLAMAIQSLEAEIAEREDAEVSLRERNELLESILSTVHFLVAFLDKDLNLIRVNDAFARADTRPPEFFIGRNHFDLYPDEETESIFRRVVETGTPYFAMERPFKYPEHPEWGTSYWDWGVQPVRGESGETAGLVLTRIDVTERKVAQDALRENEQLLRTVLDTLPVGVWITDQSGKISMANPAAQAIWRGARYVGLEQYGEYKGWWADTGERIEAEDWALARAISRGEVSINEMVEIQCFDGTRKTILNSAYPIQNERNEIVRAIVVNQDVTELKQIETELRGSEQRLRHHIELLQKIVDGITDPLIMLDKEGWVTMVNKAAMDYYGATEAIDFFGRPCFQGLRGRESTCPGCDYPFPSVDDQPVTFERKGLTDSRKVESVTVYPVLNESGERDAVIVKTSDVTQARLLERQILHNQKLTSLGLMTSGIAHEINNPNSFIYFNIPILRQYLEELMPILDEYAALHPDFEVLHMSYGELKEDIFKLLGNMEHGSQRINKIVGTLKSFVRKRDAEGLQRVDLKPLIDKVVALCHAEIRRTVRSFEVLVPEDLPPIQSDPEALEQVLLNLLINAVHACDKEDSRVRLKVDRGCDGRDEFILEISDNGSGIEEAVGDRIFDPFFTTKPASKGTGLGLYICHHHVESLGGSIEVESSVGQGSTFRIVLPRTDKQQVTSGVVSN